MSRERPFRSYTIERDTEGLPTRMIWNGDYRRNAFTFVIKGRCPTKGSTKSFVDPKSGCVVTKADNDSLRQWTRDAKWQARAAKVPLIYKPHGVIVNVLVEFVKPKTSKLTMPTVRPDADKLLRAILDAMTGIAYADDSQVVSVTTSKAYGPSERVTVTIERVA